MANNNIERDENDFMSDYDPFIERYQCKCGRIKNHRGIICDFCDTECAYIGDKNAIYKGAAQDQLHREQPLTQNASDYYILLESIFRHADMSIYYRESRFIHNHIFEIMNRLCTECELVKNVIALPNNYKDKSTEDFLPDIIKFMDYAINYCKYVSEETIEKMIDTVEQRKIDDFILLFSTYAAGNLVRFVNEHT